jgi:hypothetical protein
MQDKETLINKYKSNTLLNEDIALFEKLIEEGKIDLNELDIYREIIDQLSNNDTLLVSSKMDHRFFEHLSTLKKDNPSEKSNSLNHWSKYFTWLIISLLACFVFWLGTKVGQKPVQNDNDQSEFAVELLNAEDISEKINLVSSVTIVDDIDIKIINTLLFTLNNDRSNNVRLACIEVLINYMDKAIVREGLINAISSQNSSLVVSSIADALNANGANISKSEISERINNKLPPPVKQSLLKNLQEL